MYVRVIRTYHAIFMSYNRLLRIDAVATLYLQILNTHHRCIMRSGSDLKVELQLVNQGLHATLTTY